MISHWALSFSEPRSPCLQNGEKHASCTVRWCGGELGSAKPGAWPLQTLTDSEHPLPRDRTVGGAAGSSMQEPKGKGPGGELGLQGLWRVLEGGGQGPPRCGRDHEASRLRLGKPSRQGLLRGWLRPGALVEARWPG